MTIIRSSLRNRTRVLVAAATACLVLGAGVAYATIPSSDGVISACFATSGGALRVIDADVANCKRGEQLLTWNQQGIPGLNGLNGANGQDGADGQDGVDGVNGANGQDGADGQDGATGVSGYEIVTADFELELVGVTTGEWLIACPDGKKVLGGGIAALDTDGDQVYTSDLLMESSHPRSTPNGSGWVVRFTLDNSNEFLDGVRLYATCATMG